ncbi:MAG: hypothetical protein Q7S40_17385 [Opitutaceae bacterium]|nr:hypothetical protein [Opitutaceae bacterium]
MKSPTLARLAGVSLAILAVQSNATGVPLSGATYFDATPATGAASAATEVQLLRPETVFDAARGFGWTRPPTSTFAEKSWLGVRSPAMSDGVVGNHYTLRLALAPGRWTAIVFLDDGYRDAHLVTLAVDGRVVPHNPREFGLEEEPSPPPINRFRVAQLAFECRGGATELRFAHQSPHGARLLALHVLPDPKSTSEAEQWFLRQIHNAGRIDSRVSLEALRFELASHASESAMAAFAHYWKAQLDLLAEAEHWHQTGGWNHVSVQTRSSMFTRYKNALSLLDALVEHPDGAAFPLRPRALWLRARLLYWIEVEQHLAKDKEAFLRDIATLRATHPEHRLIAMYAGEKVDEPDPWDNYAPPVGAPAWSTSQFEALQRLRDVAHYWIDERQIPNGELGGKPDDDVETLRWWPTLMFSGDGKVTEAFARMAEGVWFSKHVHRGYSKEPRDVEHSAEFVADTVPMMALITRSDLWIDRLAWSHGHMRDLWTGRNTRGELQFKSAWIGATAIQAEPPKNRDVSMNARATKAVRFFAWLRKDAAAEKLLHEWSRTWARAALRTDKGKPAGLFPASLRWPDAAINGDEPSWHRAAMFWHYFDWTADGLLYDQLLYSWLRTRDAELLKPMEETLRFLNGWADATRRSRQPEGSAGWAADRLFRSADFWGVVAQWRLETADTRFDSLLKQHAPPYLRFRLTSDAQSLAAGIEKSMLAHLRYNTPLRTTEVLFTDRIHVARDVDNWSGVDLVVAMLTGNHVPDGMSPYYHVAWERAPQTFTALVRAASERELSADVFLHQRQPAGITVRLFRLMPGDYQLTLSAGAHVLLKRDETIAAPDHRLNFDLPGHTVVRLQLTAKPASP